jgi:hypothetical protein
VAVWVDDSTDFEYYSCPLLFIPDVIWDWWAEYSYYQAFPGTAPKYEEQSSRFIEASMYYRNRLNTLIEEKSKSRTSRGDDPAITAMLKKAVQWRNQQSKSEQNSSTT